MTDSTNISQRFAALASALVLSLLLIAGTVTVPMPAKAASQSAFVSAVA